jgi:hypothetical protein
LHRCIVGSPRALTRPTFNRRRRCSTSFDPRLGVDRANDRNRRNLVARGVPAKSRQSTEPSRPDVSCERQEWGNSARSHGTTGAAA